MEAMARASSTEAFNDVLAVGERDHVTSSGSLKLDARR
jgi:hypothetical protein